MGGKRIHESGVISLVFEDWACKIVNCGYAHEVVD
jgi:hypothetical protein